MNVRNTFFPPSFINSSHISQPTLPKMEWTRKYDHYRDADGGRPLCARLDGMELLLAPRVDGRPQVPVEMALAAGGVHVIEVQRRVGATYAIVACAANFLASRGFAPPSTMRIYTHQPLELADLLRERLYTLHKLPVSTTMYTSMSMEWERMADLCSGPRTVEIRMFGELNGHNPVNFILHDEAGLLPAAQYKRVLELSPNIVFVGQQPPGGMGDLKARI